MNEKMLETKEDLKSIIDAAFYDFDDYVTECHESGIDVTEDVEDFVADAIIKAGYVIKLNATDIKYGHDDPVGEKGVDGVDGIREMSKEKQIEEMTYIAGSCESVLDEFCEKHETCAKCKAERVYNAGYRKQIEGKWVNNHCSICGMTPIGEETWEMLDMTPPKYELFMDYCPTCGARMIGGE